MYAGSPGHESAERIFIPFIHVLRAIASSMVVYCHLIGQRAVSFGNTFEPHLLVSGVVLNPLGITNEFGDLGVCVFFIISGFIISHAVQNEDRLGFLIKRAFRLYPPAICAILLTVIIYNADRWWTGHENYYASIPPIDVLKGFTLVDTLMNIPMSIIPVGWTLGIEIVFYIHVAVIMSVVKRSPYLAAVLLCAWFGLLTYFALPAAVNYRIPFLYSVLIAIEHGSTFTIGMFAYAWYTGRCTSVQFVAGVVVSYTTFLFTAGATQPFLLNGHWPMQIVLAAAIFCVGMLMNSRMSLGPVSRFVGNVSYSLYLVHASIGMYFLGLALPIFGFGIVTVIVGVGSSLLVAWAIFTLVERPSQNLARSLLVSINRLRPNPGFDRSMGLHSQVDKKAV